ncbi:hypothetical protein [Peribacillus acanthi]|uniref:hypothetical protein n=1 Tax=Peribacillus acanthi TaxID=2171554 RepID=UPI000D3E982F|nr:hypothetical protein [Peribacillus acanthi]
MKKMMLFILMILLVGCSKSNFTDGDKNVTKEMNEAISNYIVEHYKDSYSGTDRQFEVHRVYGTEESNGNITVYMWSYYSGFNVESGTAGQGGHSLPARVMLKKDGAQYKVVKYKEPMDGSGWSDSVKEMFPDRYESQVFSDSGHLGELEEEMNKKVEKWLEELK